MIQFPAAPIVGQIFSPIPGVSYKFDGIGWGTNLSGTPTGDITVIGDIQVSGQGLFADGTLAAPGISWANEPSMGIWRNAPGAMAFIVGGVSVFGINATSVATGVLPFLAQGSLTVSGATTLNGTLAVGGPALLNGTLTVGGVSNLDSTNIVNNATIKGTLFFKHASSTTSYGPISISSGTADLSGAVNVYGWFPNPAASVGIHTFSALNGSGVLRVTGATYNTGSLGATIQVSDAGATANIAGIDFVHVSGAFPSSNTSEMRFSIARAGTFNPAGDMILQRNTATGTASLKINGSFDGVLSVGEKQPLLIEGTPYPGLCLLQTGISAVVMIHGSGVTYWGNTAAAGPVSGYAMNILGNGAVSAGSFNPVSDRRLKDNIRTLGPTLGKVLQLSGIRFFNRFTQREDIGLVAQDVEPIFPEFVTTQETLPVEPGGPIPTIATLNYNALIAPIIEAIRELNDRLTTLEAANAAGPK